MGISEYFKSRVYDLRCKTGCGMLDCMKALQETGDDMDKAEEWLKERRNNSFARLENKIIVN